MSGPDMRIEPTGAILGARIHGLDLAKPLTDRQVGRVLAAVGCHGLVCFPGQKLEPIHLRDFAAQFGDLQEPAGPGEPGLPEVGLLSNIVDADGRNIGNADAGLIWHTDMTYRKVIGFSNILYAIEVPRRDGQALGTTQFLNLHAAYDDLPAAVKDRLKDAVGIHSDNRYRQAVREAGVERPGRATKHASNRPPVPHPILLTHPITGRKVLYCDPAHVERIEGMTESESAATIAFLIEHQTQRKYRFDWTWTEGDVLMWDNVGTLHRALPDYGLDEHRLIKRCQVLGNKIWDRGFMARALAGAE